MVYISTQQTLYAQYSSYKVSSKAHKKRPDKDKQESRRHIITTFYSESHVAQTSYNETDAPYSTHTNSIIYPGHTERVLVSRQPFKVERLCHTCTMYKATETILLNRAQVLIAVSEIAMATAELASSIMAESTA